MPDTPLRMAAIKRWCPCLTLSVGGVLFCRSMPTRLDGKSTTSAKTNPRPSGKRTQANRREVNGLGGLILLVREAETTTTETYGMVKDETCHWVLLHFDSSCRGRELKSRCK